MTPEVAKVNFTQVPAGNRPLAFVPPPATSVTRNVFASTRESVKLPLCSETRSTHSASS